MDTCYNFKSYCESDLEANFLVVPTNIWCHGEALRQLNRIPFRQSWSRRCTQGQVMHAADTKHWDCRTWCGLQSQTACNRDGTNTVASATAVRPCSCCSTLLANFSIRHHQMQENIILSKMYCYLRKHRKPGALSQNSPNKHSKLYLGKWIVASMECSKLVVILDATEMKIHIQRAVWFQLRYCRMVLCCARETDPKALMISHKTTLVCSSLTGRDFQEPWVFKIAIGTIFDLSIWTSY